MTSNLKCGNCKHMFKNIHESEYGCRLSFHEVCDYDPACSDYKEKEYLVNSTNGIQLSKESKLEIIKALANE